MRTLAQLQSLQGCWALITGGSGHVGQAAADTLLELGAHVILLDRNEKCLHKLHQETYNNSPRVHTLVCDLADKQAIVKAMQSVAKIADGKLNILINNIINLIKINLHQEDIELYFKLLKKGF